MSASDYSIPPDLARALRNARTVAALTGAGVSAESGVPTFRDAQTGLWAQFDPCELATPSAFARNPTLVWDWYAMRRALVRGVAPNAGHYALAALDDHVPECLVATQNVDGLHQQAGSRWVIELHGNITRVKCASCGRQALAWDDAGPQRPPRCAYCSGPLRPDVVWFEEMLPDDAVAAAERAVGTCDVLLVAGTSSEVYPAAELPRRALRSGARVVEINPLATPLSELAHDTLRGPSGVVLPALVAAAFPA